MFHEKHQLLSTRMGNAGEGQICAARNGAYSTTNRSHEQTLFNSTVSRAQSNVRLLLTASRGCDRYVPWPLMKRPKVMSSLGREFLLWQRYYHIIACRWAFVKQCDSCLPVWFQPRFEFARDKGTAPALGQFHRAALAGFLRESASDGSREPSTHLGARHVRRYVVLAPAMQCPPSPCRLV